MPIYEYTCAACGGEFEQLVRGGTRVSCPTCESAKVDRRMSVTSRPAGSSGGVDYSKLGPPKGGSGGCGGGGCGCH